MYSTLIDIYVKTVYCSLDTICSHKIDDFQFAVLFCARHNVVMARGLQWFNSIRRFVRSTSVDRCFNNNNNLGRHNVSITFSSIRLGCLFIRFQSSLTTVPTSRHVIRSTSNNTRLEEYERPLALVNVT